jgi:hypothetical protein
MQVCSDPAFSEKLAYLPDGPKELLRVWLTKVAKAHHIEDITGPSDEARDARTRYAVMLNDVRLEFSTLLAQGRETVVLQDIDVPGLVHHSAEFSSDMQEEVARMMRRFNSCTVNGAWFHLPGRYTVPRFRKVASIAQCKEYRPDLVGEYPGGRWVVEVLDDYLASNDYGPLLGSLSDYAREVRATPWLVTICLPPKPIVQRAIDTEVLLSGPNEYQKLIRHFLMD